jgi:hypothetical protein
MPLVRQALPACGYPPIPAVERVPARRHPPPASGRALSRSGGSASDRGRRSRCPAKRPQLGFPTIVRSQCTGGFPRLQHGKILDSAARDPLEGPTCIEAVALDAHRRRIPTSQQWRVQLAGRQRKDPDINLLAQAVLTLGEQLQRAAQDPSGGGSEAGEPERGPLNDAFDDCGSARPAHPGATDVR